MRVRRISAGKPTRLPSHTCRGGRRGPRRPCEVVREEGHPPHFAIDLDEGGDAAEASAVRRVPGDGRVGRGADLLVGKYLRRVLRPVGGARLLELPRHV